MAGHWEWTTISLSAEIPANVAKASILLYSSKGNIGTFYIDNVTMEKAEVQIPEYVTNLGVQVKNTSIPTGAIGKDSTGKDVVYTVITGDSGQFVVVDIKSNTILKQLDIPGVTGSWAVTYASDGTVYIGGYNSAYVYRYYPSTGKLENLGIPIAGSSVLYQICEAGNGRIYGGAYPSGAVWEYDPASRKFTNLGRTVEGSDYMPMITYKNNLLSTL